MSLNSSRSEVSLYCAASASVSQRSKNNANKPTLHERNDLPNTAGRTELLTAMAGKVVAKAAYVGRFKGAAPAQ